MALGVPCDSLRTSVVLRIMNDQANLSSLDHGEGEMRSLYIVCFARTLEPRLPARSRLPTCPTTFQIAASRSATTTPGSSLRSAHEPTLAPPWNLRSGVASLTDGSS